MGILRQTVTEGMVEGGETQVDWSTQSRYGKYAEMKLGEDWRN